MVEQEKNKTSLGTVFGVIGAVIGAIVILGIMGAGSSTQPISETKPSETLVSKKIVWKESFMKGCDPAKNQTAGCQCIWDKMDARWTDEELEAVFTEYAKTEKLPEAFTGMINECI